MKKLVSVMSVILALSSTHAFAAKEGRTLEEFLAQQQKKMEDKGQEFTDKVKKNKTNLFKKIDTDNDGKVTGKEMKTYVDSKKKK